MKRIVAIAEEYHFCQLHTNFIQQPAVKGNSINRGIWRIISADFIATGRLLVIRSAIIKYLKRMGIQHYLFEDFKTAYDSVSMDFLHNILIESGIPMTLVRLLKLYLSEIHIRVQVGNHFSDIFAVRTGLKQGDALSPLFSTLS
jgi:hypothetical protein